jgi:hypothetical protein
MSTVIQKVPKQLTTGVFTSHDKNTLEKKLLVFGTPTELNKKEIIAQQCYTTQGGFRYISNS